MRVIVDGLKMIGYLVLVGWLPDREYQMMVRIRRELGRGLRDGFLRTRMNRD